MGNFLSPVPYFVVKCESALLSLALISSPDQVIAKF